MKKPDRKMKIWLRTVGRRRQGRKPDFFQAHRSRNGPGSALRNPSKVKLAQRLVAWSAVVMRNPIKSAALRNTSVLIVKRRAWAVYQKEWPPPR